MVKVEMTRADWETLIIYMDDHINSLGYRNRPILIPTIMNDIANQVYSQEY